MILSSQQEQELYHANGAWQRLRLDQILMAHAKDRPDSLAFVDDPELMNVNGRPPQCLSYLQAHKKVVSLASFLSGVGLKRDTVIAMLLPPSVDAALLLLAASRLGLIIAPLPLSLGENELSERLEEIGAKAVVCSNRYEDDLIAERTRNVAASMFSIRFVFCLGDDVPDGLVDLGPVMDDVSESEETLFDEDGLDSGTADDVLSLQWSTANQHPSLPMGRSHNQMLAAARYHIAQSGLEAEQCVFMAHHWSGLPGLAACFCAALLQGARLQFHHFQTYQRLETCIGEFGGQHIMLPAHGWERLHDLLSDTVREQVLSFSMVWVRYHSGASVFRDNETAARIVDVTNFNELALHCQIRRQPGIVGTIALGETLVGNSDEGMQIAWLDCDLFGLEEAKAQFDSSLVGGELCVKGPMVPSVAFPEPGSQNGQPMPDNRKGFIHTDIGCRVVDQQDEQMYFVPLGDLSDILQIGALAVHASELDTLYQACETVQDAAAFVRVSASGGQELMAAIVGETSFELDDLLQDLAERNISRHKWPVGLVHVSTIPRQSNGMIHRGALLNHLDDKKVA